MIDSRQRVEITAVDVPDQDVQPTHAIGSWSENRLPTDNDDCGSARARHVARTSSTESACNAAAPSAGAPGKVVASMTWWRHRSSGAQRSGRVGPKRTMLGVPVAAA